MGDGPITKRDHVGRWLKGASANPSGRAKLPEFIPLLAAELQKPDVRDGSKTKLAALIERWVDAACRGDRYARGLLIERLWPLPRGGGFMAVNMVGGQPGLRSAIHEALDQLGVARALRGTDDDPAELPASPTEA